MMNNTLTKDIALVILSNHECREFLESISIISAKMNPHLKPTVPYGKFVTKPHLVNHYHITLLHIANQNQHNQTAIKKAFTEHYALYNLQSKIVNFEISGITQTGPIPNGFRWLDVNYNPQNLILFDIRTNILKEFCPWHNGTLKRMFDDVFTIEKAAQVLYCGVTFNNYIPHNTVHYVDLESEKNLTTNFPLNINIPGNLQCYATHIALGIVERNGNLVEILDSFPMGLKLIGNNTIFNTSTEEL